jgi:hypothetical protein
MDSQAHTSEQTRYESEGPISDFVNGLYHGARDNADYKAHHLIETGLESSLAAAGGLAAGEQFRLKPQRLSLAYGAGIGLAAGIGTQIYDQYQDGDFTKMLSRGLNSEPGFFGECGYYMGQLGFNLGLNTALGAAANKIGWEQGFSKELNLTMNDFGVTRDQIRSANGTIKYRTTLDIPSEQTRAILTAHMLQDADVLHRLPKIVANRPAFKPYVAKFL